MKIYKNISSRRMADRQRELYELLLSEDDRILDLSAV